MNFVTAFINENVITVENAGRNNETNESSPTASSRGFISKNVTLYAMLSIVRVLIAVPANDPIFGNPTAPNRKLFTLLNIVQPAPIIAALPTKPHFHAPNSVEPIYGMYSAPRSVICHKSLSAISFITYVIGSTVWKAMDATIKNVPASFVGGRNLRRIPAGN